MAQPIQPPMRTKKERQAAVAAALAGAYRNGDVASEDALRIIRHELRRLQVNKKLLIPKRSTAAHSVVVDYLSRGVPIPRNGSDDALHADHVHPLSVRQLRTLQTIPQWLRAFKRLEQVVCVTAAENYRLEQIERQGVKGPAKYKKANIEFVDNQGRPWDL